ncbi:hypothetical protein CDAR_388221 [Caerostris darwini]|uniref:Uncharacterized protein n=1 Tax=Caerostris darwini TaxID=1538125 RepID=A0AAV4WCE5_9ARAC|nr:hypothetical protein CDAR_388221 [Caerostris darwini]
MIDVDYWNGYKSATQHLKTQMSPLTHVESLSNEYNISTNSCEHLQHFTSVVSVLPSKRMHLLNLNSNKAEALPLELKSYALGTICTLLPQNEGLHMYTDGSNLP